MRLSRLIFAGILGCALLAPSVHADECDPNDPTLLKPDLQALPPTRARAVQRNGARRLYFTSTLGNYGPGPLIIQGQTVQTPSGPVTQATQIVQRTAGTTCTHIAGYFVFHATHNHWHFNDIADYQLRKDDPFTGPIIASANKVSFCLIDIEQLRIRGSDGQRQVYANCLSQESVQGISAGWADVYDDFLPDQWIELDADPNNPVPAGGYYLVNVADPDNLLITVHSDPEAKSGVVSVSVPALIGSSSSGGSSGGTSGGGGDPGGTGRPPRQPRPPRAPRPPRPTSPGHPAHSSVQPPTHPTHPTVQRRAPLE